MRISTIFKTLAACSMLAGGSAALADGTAAWASDIDGNSLTTVQGGLVYGYNGGNWNYYYSPPAWYVTEFDEWALLQGTNGQAGVGYFGVALTAPRSVGATAAPKMDVSDASYVVAKIGNFCNIAGGGCPGSANVLTLVLSNGTNALNLYTDPRLDPTATAVCSADVTLAGQGDGLPVGPSFPSNRLHAMFTYKVPMSKFKCSKGSLGRATAGLTTVGVEVRADKNAAAMAYDLTTGGNEMEMVAVSRIAFGH
jgi:hypothetical protein